MRLLLPLLVAIAAQAQAALPQNDGWVTDLAGLLKPLEEKALEQELEAYKRRTGRELAILSVTEIGGQPIERFALEVARAWKIGSPEASNGALLVVVKADRALRIEVGRGLEGALTDSICGRIIREVIVPSFREGGYYTGLVAGVEAMQKVLGGGELPESLRHGQNAYAGIKALLIFVLIIFWIVATRGRQGRGTATVGSFGHALATSMLLKGASRRAGSFGGGCGGGFGGFGGGGGFSGGGASGRW